MHKKIHILIQGGTGKLGKSIIDLSNKDEFEFKLFKRNEEIPANLSEFNVILDVSLPEATLKLAQAAAKAKKPLIIGCTGHREEQRTVIQQLANEIPILLTPNFSLGIAVMHQLLASAGRSLTLYSFDIELIESHHRLKKDAPAGTALAFARTLQSASNQALTTQINPDYAQGLKKSSEIGIHSVRGGLNPGSYEILFTGDDECITISHTSYSRNAYAKGALKAIQWLNNLTPKQPKLYTMADVYNLNLR